MCMTRPTAQLDPEILDCLRDIRDPEIGVGIVDLGLVYRAVHDSGRIHVAVTLTSRSCPLGELILEEVRLAVEDRFGPDTAIEAELVWEPRWTPDRMRADARDIFSI